jgi:predicted DNA-binding transcriptional regulator AlpA
MRRFLRYSDLKQVGVFSNRTNAARMVARGFPKPVELSPNRVAWDSAEVETWLASRPRRSPKSDVIPAAAGEPEAVE